MKIVSAASLLVLAAQLAVGSSLRYCHVDPVEQTDFCLGLNIVYNETTRSDDYYMTASARFPREKYGWVAMGAGTYIMHQALIFVMYPGTDNLPVVSVRSTSFHDPPQAVPGLPQLSIASADFVDGYHSTSFICHSCNRWSDSTLQSDATSLPWIWASNPFQEPDSDDPDKQLGRHAYYGNFFMNMAGGKSAQPSFPSITSRISSHASSASLAGSSSKVSLIAIHGIMLALAFGMLYPTGAALLAYDVKWHFMTQVATSLLALGGIMIALYRGLSAGSGLLTTHQLVGGLVGVLLIIQLFVGWFNHYEFVRTQIAPWSKQHRWLGRGLYLLGAGNVALGLAAAKTGRLVVFWCLWVVAVLVTYTLLKGRKPCSGEQHDYDQVPSDEEMVENDRFSISS